MNARGLNQGGLPCNPPSSFGQFADCHGLDNLKDLNRFDLPRVKVDALLERAGEVRLVEGDDPAFLDNEEVNDPPAGEGGLEDGGVLALGHAALDQKGPPFLGEGLGEAVA